MREIRCPPSRDEAAGDNQQSLGLLVITTHDLCSSLICHPGNRLNKNLAVNGGKGTAVTLQWKNLASATSAKQSRSTSTGVSHFGKVDQW